MTTSIVTPVKRKHEEFNDALGAIFLPIEKRAHTKSSGLFNWVIRGLTIAVIISLLSGLYFIFWGPDASTIENSALAFLKKDHSDKRGCALLWFEFYWQQLLMGPTDPATAQTLKLLALYYRSNGQLKEYENLLKQAISIQEANFRERPVETNFEQTTCNIRVCLDSLLELADFYHSQRRYQELGDTLTEVRKIGQGIQLTWEQTDSFYRLYNAFSLWRVSESGMPYTPITFAPPWKRELNRFFITATNAFAGATPAALRLTAGVNHQNVLAFAAKSYLETGRPELAAEDLKQIVAAGFSLPQRSHWPVVALDRLGLIRSFQKKYDKAELAYEGSLRLLRQQNSPYSAIYEKETLRAFADILRRRGVPVNEEKLAKEIETLPMKSFQPSKL